MRVYIHFNSEDGTVMDCGVTATHLHITVNCVLYIWLFIVYYSFNETADTVKLMSFNFIIAFLHKLNIKQLKQMSHLLKEQLCWTIYLWIGLPFLGWMTASFNLLSFTHISWMLFRAGTRNTHCCRTYSWVRLGWGYVGKKTRILNSVS